MPKTTPHDSVRTWRALTADKSGGRMLSVETDDGDPVSLGGKIDKDGLLVVKIWSKDSGMDNCNLLFIDLGEGTGVVVASAQEETEGKAWALCAAEARGRGYTV